MLRGPLPRKWAGALLALALMSVGGSLGLGESNSALAEGPATDEFGRGPARTRPPLPEFRPEVEPQVELPPLPSPPERDRLSGGVQVFVRSYRFTGNTVFDDAELAAITQPYSGREITPEELLLPIRRALARSYVSAAASRAMVLRGWLQ
jgi:hemolysin activation/secretion protein